MKAIRKNNWWDIFFRDCLSCSVLIASILLVGCSAGYYPEGFTPKRGMVCDQVTITGDFRVNGDIEGVWFNGVKANDAHFQPIPGAPNTGLLGTNRNIVATVPVGASSGPIRVKIDPASLLIIFGITGADYTFSDSFSVTGTPTAPTISSFTASPDNLMQAAPGQPTTGSTLQWQTSGTVTSLLLDGSPISPSANSSPVSPSVTTSYTLVASNKCITSSPATTTITVTPYPSLSSLNKTSYHAGETVTVYGVGLAQSGVVSSLWFVPTTGIPVQAPVVTSSATQLTAVIPSSLLAGKVGIYAVVGTVRSNSLNLAYDARLNGMFTDIKNGIDASSKHFGTIAMNIQFDAPGYQTGEYVASITNGSTNYPPLTFTLGAAGGTAFSPHGSYGVSLSTETLMGSPANAYQLSVEQFSPPVLVPVFQNLQIVSNGSVSDSWHLEFSPDDTLMLFTSIGSSNGIIIDLFDLKTLKYLELAYPVNGLANYASVIANVENQSEVVITIGNWTQTVQIF